MNQAKIGIDLMGQGDVLIDSVEVYLDFFLTPAERTEMDKKLRLAYAYYTNGDVGGCRKILDGYWPQYLKKHIQVDAQWVQQQEEPAVRSAGLPVRTPLKSVAPPSRLDRIKSWIPSF